MAKKQALRQEFRAKRQAIPQQELADASAQILKEVLVQNLVPSVNKVTSLEFAKCNLSS